MEGPTGIGLEYEDVCLALEKVLGNQMGKMIPSAYQFLSPSPNDGAVDPWPSGRGGGRPVPDLHVPSRLPCFCQQRWTPRMLYSPSQLPHRP